MKNISKFISLILRHNPKIIGIELDTNGWAKVDELVKGISLTNNFDFEILEKIVLSDDKQRFSFNEDKTLIRANQGHSISVDVELVEKEPPEILFHGTGEKYVSSIDSQGLISQNRLYVHLSTEYLTALKVGKRHGKPFVYSIQAKTMWEEGYTFYLSVNKVWLTKEVPVRFLKKYKNFL